MKKLLMLPPDIQAGAVPLLESIYQLPFNQQMATGQLPHEKFLYYLLQDVFYLTDFARALAIVGGRSPSLTLTAQWIELARATIAEQQAQLRYLDEQILQGRMPEQLRQTEPMPACFTYTHYLLATASLASIEEAIASLIPCFWVYYEIGSRMALQLYPQHPYYHWIALYTGADFIQSAQAALALFKQLMQEASPTVQQRAYHLFMCSVRLEYVFWDAAYQQQQWVL